MIKNRVVIDACVFLKLFLDEEGSNEARIFFKKIVTNEDTQIIVPSLFLHEVMAQISKTNFSLEIVFECFKMYNSVCLTVVDIDLETSLKAKDIIATTSHPKSGFPSFYDASYHALAMLNNCDFITADKKHYDKTKQLGSIKLLEDVVSKNLTNA